MRDCPTRQASRDIEQMQQMFNINKDQTILQSPLMDTDQHEQTITPVETRDNFNLQRVKMIQPHFAFSFEN